MGGRKKKKKKKGKKKKAPSTAEMLLGLDDLAADAVSEADAYEKEQQLFRQQEEQQRTAARAELQRTRSQRHPATVVQAPPPHDADEEEGSPDYRRLLLRWGVPAAVVGILLWYGWSWLGFDAPPPPPLASPPLDAVALYGEFAADTAVANAKYARKTVQIGGKVKSVDSANRTMVFEADSGGEWSLVCGFADASELADVSAGMNVIIEGVCSGQGKPQTDVLLRDCTVLKLGAVQTAGVWDSPFSAASRRER